MGPRHRLERPSLFEGGVGRVLAVVEAVGGHPCSSPLLHGGGGHGCLLLFMHGSGRHRQLLPFVL